MPSSRRNSWLAALTLIALAAGSAAAHRRDEYLQATRVDIAPDGVSLAIDLTPGMAVAAQVLAAIDGDGDRSIAAAEGLAYAQRVVSALALDVDGRPLDVELVDRAFPTVDAVLEGTGTIRIRARAAMPNLGGGLHHLQYRNAHRPEIGAYLSNALVPASDRVTLGSPRRDVDQRTLAVSFVLLADRTTQRRAWLLLVCATLAVALAGVWGAARRRTRHMDERPSDSA